jgi:hypothetical protein
MGVDNERIAALEARLETVIDDIAEIKLEQSAAREREKNQAVDMGKLTERLTGLIDKLEKMSTRRFGWANTIIAACGVMLLIFNLLITMPAIQYANKAAQANMATMQTSTAKPSN